MGLVYRVCEELLARLPVDDSGRRVFAETLADWRREPRTGRGLAAVVRAVAGVSFKEAASLSMCRTWLVIAGWSTAWALLGIGLSRITQGWTYRSAYDLAAWSMIGIVFFFPTAVLLSSLTRKRSVPALGLVVSSSLAGLLLVGWATPAAKRVIFGDMNVLASEFGVDNPAESTGARIFQMALPRVPLEHLSGSFAHEWPGLVAAGPPGGWHAIQMVSFSAAFVCLCALVPMIGLAVRRRGVRGRRVAITAALLFLMYRGQIGDFVAPDWVLWSFIAPWLPVATIAAVLLARGTLDPGPCRTLDPVGPRTLPDNRE